MSEVITYQEIHQAAERLAFRLTAMGWGSGNVRIFGIPRGGVFAAMAVARLLPAAILVDSPKNADVFIDDLIDSGSTARRYQEKYPNRPFAALFGKVGDVYLADYSLHGGYFGSPIDEGEYYVFPWEMSDSEAPAEDIIVRLLQYIGDDPNREGLIETPKRVLKAWDHWCRGYKMDPHSVLKTFEDGAEGCDELVLVKDIDIFSFCEHHMAPFFGKAHIAYIPNKRIVGLSKLARLAEIFASRLQVQERLTNQIADALQNELDPLGVGVIIEAKHMCMCSRGARHTQASTITSALRGCMKDEPSARSEFLRLCGY